MRAIPFASQRRSCVWSSSPGLRSPRPPRRRCWSSRSRCCTVRSTLRSSRPGVTVRSCRWESRHRRTAFPTGDTTFNGGGGAVRGRGRPQRGGDGAPAWRIRGRVSGVLGRDRTVSHLRSAILPGRHGRRSDHWCDALRNASNAPGIAPHGDGFVLAVASNGDIVGQRFDATGTPIGGIFPVSVAIGIANTRVVALPGGRFLVVWGRDGATRGRVFEADATPVGGGDSSSPPASSRPVSR